MGAARRWGVVASSAAPATKPTAAAGEKTKKKRKGDEEIDIRLVFVLNEEVLAEQRAH